MYTVRIDLDTLKVILVLYVAMMMITTWAVAVYDCFRWRNLPDWVIAGLLWWATCGILFYLLIKDTYVNELSQSSPRIQKALNDSHHKGWCDAINSVRASLAMYPHGGGDIGIMEEVDRIIKQDRKTQAELNRKI